MLWKHILKNIVGCKNKQLQLSQFISRAAGKKVSGKTSLKIDGNWIPYQFYMHLEQCENTSGRIIRPSSLFLHCIKWKYVHPLYDNINSYNKAKRLAATIITGKLAGNNCGQWCKSLHLNELLVSFFKIRGEFVHLWLNLFNVYVIINASLILIL